MTPSASARAKNSLSSRSAGTVISLGAITCLIGSVVSSSIDFGDRVLVEVAALVLGTEDLERAFALRVRAIGVPVKPMIVALGTAAIR